jgi:ribosomal protein S18 acetylase RimI-like enzyme
MIVYRHLVSQIDRPEATGANIIAIHTHSMELVGSLGLRLTAPGAFINSLYVEPSYQRHGIGRQLVQLAAKVAHQHGKAVIGLTCHVENMAAQLLYRRMGFLPYGYGKTEDYQELVATLPLAYAGKEALK